MTTQFAAGEPLVLTAEHVSKLYARRSQHARRRLADAAARTLFGGRPPEIGALRDQEFWAVNDVSFDLRRGEALGIIGLNGSGKTTLLRMLAGQILPDRGEIRVAGSSAAMIDLQAGFQPAASGRENIYLRAAALGFTRVETKGRLEEIIAFSELEEAIDAPMATYSAGMKMRLAFSVMAMVEPEVLLIDEVLAVGDFRFRQKCLARIREMRRRSAFVFVSHSMGDVARFCDRAIVMHKGQIVFEGKPDPAIAYYQTLEKDSLPQKPQRKSIIPAEVFRPEMLDAVEVAWIDGDGGTTTELVEGDAFRIVVEFTLNCDPRNLVVGVPIYSADGDVIAGFSTDANAGRVSASRGDRVTVDIAGRDITLNPGRYRCAIGITDGPEFLYMKELPDFSVKPSGRKSWGTVTVPYEIAVSAAAESQLSPAAAGAGN